MLKQKILIGLVLVGLAIVIFVYFNRAYARIYDFIGQGNLSVPTHKSSFLVSLGQVGESSSTPLVYTALGDSLTAGVGANVYQEIYSYLVATQLAMKDQKMVILKNRAVPGAKSGDLISGFVEVAVRDQPDIVTILIGVNDVHGDVKAAAFFANYDYILKTLKEKTNAKIYAVAIPFIGADYLYWPPYKQLYDYRTKKFNEIIQQLAIKYGIEYIDLYSPTREKLRVESDYYSRDLFHPAATGYQEWAQIIGASLIAK